MKQPYKVNADLEALVPLSASELQLLEYVLDQYQFSLLPKGNEEMSKAATALLDRTESVRGRCAVALECIAYQTGYKLT